MNMQDGGPKPDIYTTEIVGDPQSKRIWDRNDRGDYVLLSEETLGIEGLYDILSGEYYKKTQDEGPALDCFSAPGGAFAKDFKGLIPFGQDTY